MKSNRELLIDALRNELRAIRSSRRIAQSMNAFVAADGAKEREEAISAEITTLAKK